MRRLAILLAAATLASPAAALQDLSTAVPADWRSRPTNAGSWTWRSSPDASEAIFSDSRGPQFVIRCTRSTRRVSFLRTGVAPTSAIRVATTSSERTLPPGNMLLATDPLLDAIAFSRGRLWVDVQGSLPLVLRTAAEPARAVEDCRQ